MNPDQTAPTEQSDLEANIVNPDQTAPTEQSDLGPHCLSVRLQIF